MLFLRKSAENTIMIPTALVTPNRAAESTIAHIMEDMGLFEVGVRVSPAAPAAEAVRLLKTYNCELIVIDLEDWPEAANWLRQIRRADVDSMIVGFRSGWNRLEQADFEEAGVTDLIRAPFSPLELEAAVYQALHRRYPVANPNLLILMPAKAGTGCSTVALNLAAELHHEQKKKVLLIEADRRSGVLSILLDLETRSSLDDALSVAATMTPVQWQQFYEDLGIHMLLANPRKRGPLPGWIHYFYLLRFVNGRYDYIVVDMPEVVNQATAELVRAANRVYLVCTPEVPSLKMAELRRQELLDCEIGRDQIQVILNRWEKGGLSMQAVEKTLGQPVFATLANDYTAVRDSITESRVVAGNSQFSRDCAALARKLVGLPPAAEGRSAFDLLRRLGRMSAH
jgi:MinD-like ATPase involved in chromosome partitioning or flagellar assembly